MLRDVDVRSTTMAPPAPAYPYAAQVQPDSNGMATAGGVLGIVALPVSWIPVFGWFLGLPLGILAVVFGAIGMARSGKLTAATGRGLPSPGWCSALRPWL